jgi:glycosyltransferase involved in cell wall biosynthesis
MSTLSVVVPVYDAGPYLKKTIESLISEELPGLEIIVVDDGSRDNGIATIAGMPVKLLRQKNKGEAAARNAGIKVATAPFVTFLDADDLMSPGALLTRLNYLSSHPQESAVGGLPSRLVDQGGQVVAEVFTRMADKYAYPFRLSESLYRSGNFFPVSCSLYIYRREIFDQIGFFDETLPVAPDCDFHFRLLKNTEVPILKIPVFDRRIHETNLSLAGTSDETLSFRPEIIAMLRHLNLRYGFDADEIKPWELDYL